LPSLQKHYRPSGTKVLRLAVKVKMIEDEVGIADDMIERIR